MGGPDWLSIASSYTKRGPGREHQHGQSRNRRPMGEFQQIVNKMTNHERTQWARAGYPGLNGAGGNVEQLTKCRYAEPAVRRINMRK